MFVNFIHISLYHISLKQNTSYQIQKDVTVWKRLGCPQRMQRTWWQLVATPYTGFSVLKAKQKTSVCNVNLTMRLLPVVKSSLWNWILPGNSFYFGALNHNRATVVFLNTLRLNDVYMLQWTIPSLVKITARGLFGAKPLSAPMVVYFQIDPWEQNPVKFGSKWSNFRTSKCIWKCRL